MIIFQPESMAGVAESGDVNQTQENSNSKLSENIDVTKVRKKPAQKKTGDALGSVNSEHKERWKFAKTGVNFMKELTLAGFGPYALIFLIVIISSYHLTYTQREYERVSYLLVLGFTLVVAFILSYETEARQEVKKLKKKLDEEEKTREEEVTKLKEKIRKQDQKEEEREKRWDQRFEEYRRATEDKLDNLYKEKMSLRETLGRDNDELRNLIKKLTQKQTLNSAQAMS